MDYNNPQNLASQFQPAVPVQPSQSYMQSASGAQQYRPMGQPQMTQSCQPMQQRPRQPGHLSSSPQPPMFYMQPPQPQNSANTNSYAPSLGDPSYTPWMPSGNQGPPNATVVPQTGQQPSSASQDVAADWQEFSAKNGTRYYCNKKTMQTSWEKPLELMTPRELVFEDLVQRAKEKEEKEVKRLQRLAKDCSDSLYDIKEIIAPLTRKEFQQLFEESSESKATSDEITARENFMKCFARLVEKVEEKDRKREEEKARKEEKEKCKEKGREEHDKSKDKERSKKDDSDNEDLDATVEHKEDKRRDRKSHRDDASSDKDEKDDSRKSRRHGSDLKK